jgi:hypothetical protein
VSETHPELANEADTTEITAVDENFAEPAVEDVFIPEKVTPVEVAAVEVGSEVIVESVEQNAPGN